MSNIYLHIGTHKTGTTAIQRFLLDNRDALKSLDTLYPKTGLTDSPYQWGHHRLAWILGQKNMQGIWIDLRREAEAYSKVIISSEEFSLHLSPAPFSRMMARIASWATVKPICYLRRQDQFLESLYNQYVKSGGTGSLNDVFDMVIQRLDYTRLIGSLEMAFGKPNLILRIYEESSVQNDVLKDFSKLVGMHDVPNLFYRNNVINGALSQEGLEALRKANQLYHDNPTYLDEVRSEIVLKYNVPPFSPHTLMTKSERSAFMAKFDKANQKIAEEYFSGKTPLFG